MNKNTCKEGIALVSVVLAIMVLLMLSGLVTYIGNDMINTSKMTAFAKDTDIIYEAAEEYYIVNGDIPTLAGGVQFDYETYLNSITDSKYSETLISEISANEDQEAMFYEIDLSKIGIEDSRYGVKSNEDDIFLISNNSHCIYYYPGYEVQGNIYFSNTFIISK